jgi:hypothetical protein
MADRAQRLAGRVQQPAKRRIHRPHDLLNLKLSTENTDSKPVT